MDIKDIFNKYINEKTVSLRSLDEGHINDTFLVETENGKYVLQRLNERINVEKLLYNYKLYSKAFDDNGMLYPKWIELNKNGNQGYINNCSFNISDKAVNIIDDSVNITEKPVDISYDKNDIIKETHRFFFEDSEGHTWRLYTYIDGDSVNFPVSEEEAFSLGEGLAKMHNIMLTIKEEPKAVYPHLHDIGYYFDLYKICLHNEILCKQEFRSPDIEKLIEDRIETFLNNNYVNRQTVHADPKLSNVIFRNGKATGFIDMDTIMTGLIEEDIADCIRSCCIYDGIFDTKIAKKITEGYESVYFSINKSNTNTDTKFDAERISFEKRIEYSFNKICFELALRFYTDAISGENYFKGKSPEYLIKRAEELLCNISLF